MKSSRREEATRASRSLRRAERIWERASEEGGTWSWGGAEEEESWELLEWEVDDGGPEVDADVEPAGRSGVDVLVLMLSLRAKRENCLWRESRSPASVQKAR